MPAAGTDPRWRRSIWPACRTPRVAGASGAAGAEVLEIAAGAPAAARVRTPGDSPARRPSVDLVHAKRIVAAGSGARATSCWRRCSELAELLEGSVGATRPVVDDGRLPKERLIGQTGRTVTPELYVALGISGLAAPRGRRAARRTGSCRSTGTCARPSSSSPTWATSPT